MNGCPVRADPRTLRVAALAFLMPGLLAGAVAAQAAGGRQASEAELKALLAELSRRGGDLRSLEVRFRQEKMLRILRRPRVSLGELAFDHGMVSIITRDKEGAVESRLLVRDGEMKLYYPALERMEVFPASQEKPGGQGGAQAGQEVGILLFTNGWDKLGESYRAKLVEEEPPVEEKAKGAEGEKEKEKEKRWLLTLEPRQPGSKLKKVEVLITGHRVREYRQEETSGDRIRLEVLEWIPNPKIPEGRFKLEVPAGTKTFRPAG